MTKLHDYVHQGNIEALHSVLKRDSKVAFKEIHPITGDSLLHEAVKAFEAGKMRPVSEDRRLEVALFLVKEAEIPLSVENFGGITPHKMAHEKYGQKNKMTYLLDELSGNKSKKIETIQSDAIEQRLFQVARSGNILDMQEEIETLSGSVNFDKLRDYLGNTLLMIATLADKNSMIRLLINDERLNIDILAKNRDGETAWDIAQSIEAEEILRDAEYHQRKY